MAGQTSVSMNPALGMPGLLVDTGEDMFIKTKISKSVAQVSTITITTATNSTLYTVTINGVPCTFTTDASATDQELAEGIVDAITQSSYNGLGAPYAFYVTATTASPYSSVVVTANEEDRPFTIAVSGATISVATGTLAGGTIGFGLGVAQGNTADQCVLPSSSGSVLIGVSVLDQTEPNQIDGSHEYQPGAACGILTKGRVWVVVEDAVTVNGNVYVRYAAGSGGDVRGAFRSDADSSTAAQLTGAVYATSASSGGYAVVEINKP